MMQSRTISTLERNLDAINTQMMMLWQAGVQMWSKNIGVDQLVPQLDVGLAKVGIVAVTTRPKKVGALR